MADSKIHYMIHLATWMKWYTLFCVLLSFYLMYDDTDIHSEPTLVYAV